MAYCLPRCSHRSLTGCLGFFQGWQLPQASRHTVCQVNRKKCVCMIAVGTLARMNSVIEACRRGLM